MDKTTPLFYQPSMFSYLVEMFLLSLPTLFSLEPIIVQNHMPLVLGVVLIIYKNLRYEFIELFQCLPNVKLFRCCEIMFWINDILSYTWISLSYLRLVRKFLSMMHKNLWRIIFPWNRYSFYLIIHNARTELKQRRSLSSSCG